MAGYVIPPGRTAFYIEHPEYFHIDTLEANEMTEGEGRATYARIPKIEGRIRIEEDNTHGYTTEDVLLVIGREKDEETGDIIEKTVRIGSPTQWVLRGMMTISDAYHDYFDTEGNLINDPMKEETAGETPDESAGACEGEADEADEPDEADEEMPEDDETGDDKAGNEGEAKNQKSFDSFDSSRTDGIQAGLAFDTRDPADRQTFEWLSFDPDRMTTNEVRNGDVIMAKIPPRDKARINFKKRVKNGKATRYVQLVLANWYDTEKGQSRNRKVIIGTDVSHIYRGMMIINDQYHNYFDTKGNLLHPPEGTETAEAADDQLNEETGSVNEQHEPGQETEQEANEDEVQKELDRQKRIRDYIDLMTDIFRQYKDVTDEQVKRRPDRKMSAYQIRRINELLAEMQRWFKGCEGEDYLKLAEEPDEDDPEHSGTTYGDMAILLSAYDCILRSYRMGRLWQKEIRKPEEGRET